MKITMILATIVYLLVRLPCAFAQSSQPAPQVGEAHKITKRYETSERTSDGSSGSSTGSDVFLERVIAVRSEGVELEYDLPLDVTVEERDREWQFPARIYKPLNGPAQLVNRDQLEARLENWLRSAGWDRSVCGRWIFTWNAFLIDCDPESVLRGIQEIDLRVYDPSNGAPYSDVQAIAPGVLVEKSGDTNGAVFTATLEIDPVAVQRARAEADVASGEIMNKPITLEAALSNRTKEQVSGTIAVTLEADAAGSVRKRTKVTKLEIKQPDGTSETRTATEIVERERVTNLADHQ